MYKSLLSFVIPAFNEEKNISSTIRAIQQNVPEGNLFEVIVVDHGSSDDTAKIADSCGASIFVKNGGTVAGLRNYGASRATGDILVFLDADVLLTADWRSAIPHVLDQLRRNGRMITGSWVSIPENAGWIENYWFRPLEKIGNTHINSGHMILSHQFFDELGGFDEKLETGEDYDISMRAKSISGELADNHALKVIHTGYPKNVTEFIRREYWHAKGDALSVKTLLNSKVASLSILFCFLTAIMLISLLLRGSADVIALSGMTILILICLLSSLVKYRHATPLVIAVNALIYALYFYARGVSSMVHLFAPGFKKRVR